MCSRCCIVYSPSRCCHSPTVRGSLRMWSSASAWPTRRWSVPVRAWRTGPGRPHTPRGTRPQGCMPRGPRGAGAPADMTNPRAFGSRPFFSCRDRLPDSSAPRARHRPPPSPRTHPPCRCRRPAPPCRHRLATRCQSSSGLDLRNTLVCIDRDAAPGRCHRRSVCAPSPAWHRILCLVSRVHPGGLRYSPGWTGAACFRAVSWRPASPPVSHVPRSCVPNNPPSL